MNHTLPTNAQVFIFFSHPWHKNQLLRKAPHLREKICFVGKNRLTVPTSVAKAMQADTELSKHFRLGHGTTKDTDRRRSGDKKKQKKKIVLSNRLALTAGRFFIQSSDRK